MDRLRDPNGFRCLRQIHFPGTVDAIHHCVLLDGEELQNSNPDVMPQELCEQFVPSEATLEK